MLSLVFSSTKTQVATSKRDVCYVMCFVVLCCALCSTPHAYKAPKKLRILNSTNVCVLLDGWLDHDTPVGRGEGTFQWDITSGGPWHRVVTGHHSLCHQRCADLWQFRSFQVFVLFLIFDCCVSFCVSFCVLFCLFICLFANLFVLFSHSV